MSKPVQTFLFNPQQEPISASAVPLFVDNLFPQTYSANTQTDATQTAFANLMEEIGIKNSVNEEKSRFLYLK
jgi:hypothetical protein